ncbi:MAG: ferredoxin family protein [Armatimonadetes bacterium]|nr:ferredoxin family protein [Armatimonadota bacterium]
MATGTTLIISRRGALDPEAEARERALAACASGAQVLVTPHLYHVPDESPIWGELAGLSGPVALLSWLHPRAVEWLLRRRGVEISEWCLLNLDAFPDAEAACRAARAALGAVAPEGSPDGAVRVLDAPALPRWYPVVDRERCADCQHCLQFCLFGVYALGEEGRVVVRHPDRCKPGCPACSRICPEGAIMFPLYERDAAIAGAPGHIVRPDAAARRMFYTRTRKPCPACGSDGSGPGTLPMPPADGTCPECGRPAQAAAPETAVTDEIDALILELDNLARRRS